MCEHAKNIEGRTHCLLGPQVRVCQCVVLGEAGEVSDNSVGHSLKQCKKEAVGGFVGKSGRRVPGKDFLGQE